MTTKFEKDVIFWEKAVENSQRRVDELEQKEVCPAMLSSYKNHVKWCKGHLATSKAALATDFLNRADSVAAKSKKKRGA